MLQLIKNLLEHNLIKYIAVSLQLLVTVMMLIPTSGASYMNLPHSDKIFHIVIYLVLFVVWAITCKANRKRRYVLRSVVVLLTLYGIIIEMIQGEWIESRTSDIWDVIANSTGILIGMVIFYKLNSRIELKK